MSKVANIQNKACHVIVFFTMSTDVISNTVCIKYSKVAPRTNVILFKDEFPFLEDTEIPFTVFILGGNNVIMRLLHNS